MGTTRNAILQVNKITKRFPGVQALKGVDLQIRPGEVHALVGENGAGKSTLINILSGVYHADSGEVYVNGRKTEIDTPIKARQLGISTIYQELSVVPQLSVAENIFLGREPRNRWRLLDKRTLFYKAGAIMEGMGYRVDPRRRVDELSIAEQQLIEIARNVSAESHILIMDEPTSSLSQTEVRNLFEIVRRMRSKGIGIVYVSHQMEEVFEIADRITVFRNGEKVATVEKQQTTPREVVRMMVGREVALVPKPPRDMTSTTLLSVKGLSNRRLKNISFELGKGEILGFVGLLGSGKTELARALFGLDGLDDGATITIEGHRVELSSPLAAIRSGLGYVTESRRDDGLVLPLSVQDNTCLVVLRLLANRLGMLGRQRERSVAEEFVTRLDIKTSSVNQRVEFLSGGNQQKVVLSKWLARRPRILILDEPTRGVDVGAREEFYEILEAIAKDGVGIIVLTSDVSEAIRLCDRVMVLRKGMVAAQLASGDISYQSVLEIMTGGSRDDE